MRKTTCFKLFLFCLFVGLTCASASAQQSPCTCADARDLLNRLNEAQAAILEYRVQIIGIRDREKRDGERLPYSDELYNQILQPRIQSAINRVTDTKAQRGTAKTHELTCQTDIQAPTECLRRVIDKHEEVHRKGCKGRTPVLDRLYLADFAQEEIDAYTTEINFILNIMQTLPKLCLPGMWFGTIITTRTISEKTGNVTRTGKEVGTWHLLFGGKEEKSGGTSGGGTDGAKPDPVQEALKKMQDQMNKAGFPNLLSPFDADVLIDRKKTWKGGGTECCNSSTGVEPNIDESEEEKGQDHTKGTMTVMFVAGRLIVSFPGVSIDGNRRLRTAVISSACPYDKNSEEEKAEQLSLNVPKLEINTTSRIIGNFEILAGSKSFPESAGKITYEWNLKRVIK